MRRQILALLSFALLLGCSGTQAPQQAQPAEAAEAPMGLPPETQPEETLFRNFTDRDFSLEYPDWPAGGYSNTSILAIQQGPCMLNVDRHNASMDALFSWILNSTATNGNVTLDEVDLENHSFSFDAIYQNISFHAVFVMEYCNYETYVIGATTAQGYCAEEKEDLERSLSSAACARIYEPPDYSAAAGIPSLDGTELRTFTEGDLSMEVPLWNMSEATGEESVFAYAWGPCFVALNKYNTPADNLFGWIEGYVGGNGSMALIHKDVPGRGITYEFPYGNYTLRARSRVVYCNYNSYTPVAVCESGYFLNNSAVLDRIVGSASCARDYSFSQEIKEEEAQEPEDESVVETDAGSEYGINADAVVRFFNGNPLFVKVMRPYDRVNLRVTDEDIEDIRLKAILDEGIIVSVKEGSYSDADLTIIIPLDDALNIFSNADRITLGNALGFVVNVRTDPPQMKSELIAAAFKP